MIRNGWHILGAGAIGSLFAQALSEAGSTCTLLTRRAGETQREIQILRADIPPVTTVLPCETPAVRGSIHRLLVTTKAYDVEDALAAVAHRLQRDSEIVLLTNGMGLAEVARRLCPAAAIYCGTTTEGAYRESPNAVRHAGRGTTLIGSVAPGEPPHWFNRWLALPLECSWERNIEAALWQKLAINCAINPLTALHGCVNGDLVHNQQLRFEFEQLCEEIAAVSAALGYRRTANTIQAAAHDVAIATAANRSSMLQDVSAGRPTEIEFITGYLVCRADEIGFNAPRNRALLAAVPRR